MKLSPKSELILPGLHPDLVRVIRGAVAMMPPGLGFQILEGLRTREQMCINYGKGRSAAQCEAKGVPGKYAKPGAAKVTWLNDPFMSNHRAMADGKGHAFDFINDPLDYKNMKQFQQIANIIMDAAKALKVPVRWGADWNRNHIPFEKGETDAGHIELVTG